jgi:hypothetical protein
MVCANLFQMRVLYLQTSKLQKLSQKFEILAQKSVSVYASLTACASGSRGLHHVAISGVSVHCVRAVGVVHCDTRVYTLLSTHSPVPHHPFGASFSPITMSTPRPNMDRTASEVNVSTLYLHHTTSRMHVLMLHKVAQYWR